MGKSHKVYTTVPLNYLIEKINTKPVKELLPVAKNIFGTEYGIRFYNNKNHPKFYHNDDEFRHALRHCIHNCFPDRVQWFTRDSDIEWEYIQDVLKECDDVEELKKNKYMCELAHYYTFRDKNGNVIDMGLDDEDD